MHSTALRQLADQVYFTSEQIEKASSISHSKALAEYQSFIENILPKLKKEWGDKLSVETIEKKIRGVLEISLREESEPNRRALISDTLKQTEDLWKNYDMEQIVYLPISGIQFINPHRFIELGNVSFQRLTDEIMDKILDKTESIIKTMKYSDYEKEMLIIEDRRNMRRDYLNKVCSVFKVVAEPKRAGELAVIETDKSLEIFRYFISGVYTRGKMRIDLSTTDTIASETIKTLVLSESGFWESSKRLSKPLNIDDDTLDLFSKVGVYDLSRILSKNNRSNFEDTILRFLHWISDSQMQTEKENQFLSLIIALETLFGSGSQASSFGTAILLSEELDKRKELKLRISKLQKIRNDVVHGSKNIGIDEADIVFLKSTVMELMIKLLDFLKKEEFESKRDLIDFIQEKQLS